MTHPSNPQASSQRLYGSIERVIAHNEDSGYCKLRVKVKERRDLVTVMGNAATVTVGEFIEAFGTWINDIEYGRQFKADQLTIEPPTTLEGMEKYLSSGMVKGIEPQLAKQLVEAFGESIFDVIENTPERLEELEGIGSKRRLQITAAWADQKVIREIMMFLYRHGVGTARAELIYNAYGDQAIHKIEEYPYCLALDIPGITFEKADQIARNLGVPEDARIRIQAGLLYAFQIRSELGDCGIYISMLKIMAAYLLKMPSSYITFAIDQELTAENLKRYRGLIYLPQLYWAELECAAYAVHLLKGEPPWGQIDSAQALPWVEDQTGLRLSASQREAIATVLRHKVSIITGGPGVGKTTLIKSLLWILQTRQMEVMLCAPTGRAARRLTETTGLEAKTVHRLLEFNLAESKFRRNADNPLAAQVLVLDEASMMDIVLMNQLLKALPDHAGLIIVGDVDQLPSVGPGSVLADLIGSRIIPTVKLTEIFRQSADSLIIQNARLINQGVWPSAPLPGKTSDFQLILAEYGEEIKDELMRTVTEDIPATFDFDPINDIQVLTPQNNESLGVEALNSALQQRLNPQSGPKVHYSGTDYARGDKVIQCENNYNKDVFNGDIGRVSSVDLEARQIKVQFEGREVLYEFTELNQLSLAYAITIHKSQGSEYPVVVIPLSMQHSKMLQRNLLYTAVTRGKQRVVLIAQPNALDMALLPTRSNKKRQTRLKERLHEFSVVAASQDRKMESLPDRLPTPFWLSP
jgi:exodeoxyribonuclease V alpha subunit